MDYWWIGYALAIFTGIVLGVYGLWGRQLDQARDAEKSSSSQA
jgi:hypothetical protein